MMIQTTTRPSTRRRSPRPSMASLSTTRSRRALPVMADGRVIPAATRGTTMGWQEELMTVTFAGLLAFGLSLDGWVHAGPRRNAIGLD